MEIGKVPNDVLQRLILNKIQHKRKEVIIRPGIGEDCCAVDFGEYTCVLSTDPITGAVNDIGRLAVHVSCNDIASCGVEPLGLLITILAPPDTKEEELETVMGQICETAASLNVEIIGGHTEITASVNRFVITSTAMGRTVSGRIVSTAGAKPGDDILVTKWVGIEGTAIIAKDKEELILDSLGAELVERAKSLVNDISVVKEGIIAGIHNATAMHDVTEGGILGAVWEVAEASDAGVIIYNDRIPILEETLKICKYFNIDPLRLISSGCMLITAGDGKEMTEKLSEYNIKATIIGKVTESKGKIMVSKDKHIQINQPEADELYKVVL